MEVLHGLARADAQGHSNQLCRALNNLIKLGLSGDCKSLVALADALIILNSNSVQSFEALLNVRRRWRASISAEIGKRVF